MTCPVCDGKTGVIDSRPTYESTRRRRECEVCGYRFFTVEVDEDLWAKVQQKVQETEAPRTLQFGVEYDPVTGAVKLLSKKEGTA